MAMGVYAIRFVMSMQDRTRGSINRLDRDLKRLSATQNGLQKSAALTDVSRSIQMRGLLGSAAMGYAATKAANFESAVTKAATQVAGSGGLNDIMRDSSVLQKSILDQMQEFPASAGQMANAAYDIFGTMNVPLKEGIGMLRLFNMVAVAGSTDLETATNTMITLANNYGKSFGSMMKTSETAFRIIRFGRLEFDEFSEMMNQIVPASVRAGQSLQDVGGAMAFLTEKVPSQPQVATAIGRLLDVFSRPDFKRGAKKMGLDITKATGELRSLPEIISELSKTDLAKPAFIDSMIPYITSKGRKPGSAGITSTTQARKALGLLVLNAKEYAEVQDLINANGAEFERRFTAMYGSSGVQFARLKAQLESLLIIVGTKAIPVFLQLAAAVQTFVQWASKHQELVKWAAIFITVTSLGALLIGTIGGIAGAWWSLALVLRGTLGPAIVRVGAMLSRLVATLLIAKQLGGSWGSVIKAILGIGTAGGMAATGGLALLAARLIRLGGISTIIIGILYGLKAVFDEFMQKDVEGNIAQKGLRALATFQKGALGSLPGFIKNNELGQVKWMLKLDELLLGSETLTGKSTAKQKKARKEKLSTYKKNLRDLMKELDKIGDAGANDFLSGKQKDAVAEAMRIQNEIAKQLGLTGGGAGDVAAQTAQQIKDRTKDILDQAAQGLETLYNDFKQKNQELMGAIFTGPVAQSGVVQWRKQFGLGMTIAELIADTKAQVAKFTQYQSQIALLRKKGVSEELITQIKDMGADGAPIIDTLTKASPKDIKQLNANVKKITKSITTATENDFKREVARWRSFGEKAALSIAAGMESAEPKLHKRMLAMVDRLWSGVAGAMAAGEIAAQNIASGNIAPTEGNLGRIPDVRVGAGATIGIGGSQQPQSHKGRPWPTRTSNSTKGSRTTASRAGDTYHFHVNGTFMSEEQMMTNAVRKAAFKTKNRRP